MQNTIRKKTLGIFIYTCIEVECLGYRILNTFTARLGHPKTEH